MRWTEKELDEYIAQVGAAWYIDRVKQGIQKEKDAIAINGLKKGLDINLLQDLIGLSVEQIDELRRIIFKK